MQVHGLDVVALIYSDTGRLKRDGYGFIRACCSCHSYHPSHTPSIVWSTFLPVTSCLPPCSAGVGRTGTFITIDAMMERLNAKDDLNIYQFVTEMRSRRTFMVQTMVSVCSSKCKYT